jgi:hypothetical protein
MRFRFEDVPADGQSEENWVTNIVQVGKWNHLVQNVEAGSNNAVRMKSYVNGVFYGESNADMSTPVNKARTQQWIGRSSHQWDPYFKGQLDDFRIYNGELSPVEVSSIYAETVPPTVASVGALYGPTAFTASGLPSGLSIDSTGAIRGRTTAIGDHNITVGASNLSGNAPTQTFTLSITPNTPVFLDADGNGSNNLTLTGRNSILGEYSLIETGGANPTVSVYYGLTDGGTTAADLPRPLVWLDANDASTITESSNAVSQWNDKSVNANHSTQSSENLKPLLVANALGGKPVIRFDGTSGSPDGLQVGDVRTSNGPVEVFAVSQSSDTGDADWQRLMGVYTSGNIKPE